MDSETLDLRQQVAVLRRRWRILVAGLALGAVAGIGYATIQDPVFAATAQVLVSQRVTEEPTSIELDPTEIATQVLVLRSEAVADAVIEQLDLDVSAEDLLEQIEVGQVDDTRVLTIEARTGDAQQSASIANAFADQYLAERNEAATISAATSVQALQDRYDRMAADLEAVQQELGALSNQSGPRAGALRAEEQTLTVQLTNLLSDLTAAEQANQQGRTEGQVLVRATPPTEEARAGLLRMSVLGGALGLFLAVGLAFVKDHFDDVVRDEETLREVLRERPVLGRIPRATEGLDGRLVTLVAPQSPSSEAYRSLSSSVRFMLAAGKSSMSPDAPRRVVLISSPSPGEGKTTVAANLAVAAARFGLNVILVDADLRRPSVGQRLGLGSPPGLSDMLATGEEPDRYLVDVGVPGLQVLSGGSIPPNPAELLGSSVTMKAVHALRERADLIIIDSAPITRVADTRELMDLVDVMVLVIRSGVTHGRSLVDAIDRIQQVGGKVSGAVLNDVDSRRSENRYVYGDYG